MKIISAEFVKSAFKKEHWPEGNLPEIAFLGRSNVGKSSLLNSLLQRKGLARTSNTPGRTQSINYFLVTPERGLQPASGSDDVRAQARVSAFYFVDLPGYGFAKVSKTMRQDWGKMAEEYLAGREQLVLSIQLIDSRHSPTQLDRQLHEWLVFHDKPHLIVATKADKLSNNQLQKQLKEIGSAMPESTVLPYSSETGKGRDAVWSAIVAGLEPQASLLASRG